jgi:hypothetical protein
VTPGICDRGRPNAGRAINIHAREAWCCLIIKLSMTPGCDRGRPNAGRAINLHARESCCCHCPRLIDPAAPAPKWRWVWRERRGEAATCEDMNKETAIKATARLPEPPWPDEKGIKTHCISFSLSTPPSHHHHTTQRHGNIPSLTQPPKLIFSPPSPHPPAAPLHNLPLHRHHKFTPLRAVGLLFCVLASNPRSYTPRVSTACPDSPGPSIP